jgi:hypothetical protein
MATKGVALLGDRTCKKTRNPSRGRYAGVANHPRPYPYNWCSIYTPIHTCGCLLLYIWRFAYTSLTGPMLGRFVEVQGPPLRGFGKGWCPSRVVVGVAKRHLHGWPDMHTKVTPLSKTTPVLLVG